MSITFDALLEGNTVSKSFSRRRFSVLVAGAMAVPVMGVTPGLATAQDATPGATPGTSTGAESLAQMEGQVFSTGPQGESPTAASEVELSEDELAQIQGMGATAAIVMHYSGDDWSAAQIAGLHDQFEKMGIEIIAQTDANFDAGTQVSDIETVLARNP